eukprot:CAMPEP_0196807820 /NCGR_PEP_ID=MMETSP1362-20130617/7813_1 /TAXON_ID=163516 /ORGANISM="Leptocylindrus danicus, Strain CCMP1856" /LENGTH=46 /DNA_ID= /DNA_START= /DNA_END= /DNA_ORIENTATION=
MSPLNDIETPSKPARSLATPASEPTDKRKESTNSSSLRKWGPAMLA